MRFLVGLICVAWSMPAAMAQIGSGVVDLPTGQLVERVGVLADTSHSYALYLPSSYTPDRTWPVLMAFDPLARGTIPVAIFAAEAERLGWVVAGSNVARNGPLNTSLDAARKMEEDLHRRFRIDPKRIYASGFSGGARVASLVAHRSNGGITGVIGAGAGMHAAVPVEARLPFVYFNTLGHDDYNFPEILDLERRCQEAQMPCHFARFEGTHQWPPEDVAAHAMRWMEIQAMRAGSRDPDEALLARWYHDDLAAARAHESAGRTYPAYRRYRAAVADFSGLLDTQEAARGLEALASMAAEAEVAQREAAAEQMRQAQGVFAQGNRFLDPDQRFDARSELRRTIKALRREGEGDDVAGQVARRTLAMAHAYFLEAATIHHTEDEELVVAFLEVATEISPANPGAYYQLAVALARSGEKRKAIKTLEKAVEAGFGTTFGSVGWLAGNVAFDSLRNEKAFTKLVQSLQQGS